MKAILKKLSTRLRSISPLIYYLMQYRLAVNKLKDGTRKHDRLFKEFLDASSGLKCLQIGVKDDWGAKYGPNWVSVDKFDKSDFIDYDYDINDLEFEDDAFDAVACISILEHIPHPATAIKELHRVLRPGGRIWVQLPFHYPYHNAPYDYWRVSPNGLRIWMDQFEELACGVSRWCGTSIILASYYYGKKLPATK